MPAASESITEKQLSRWKLLRRFIDLLDKQGAQIVPQRREVHGLRELDRGTYFGLFLFGLFNPVVTSMRALCAATRLRVRDKKVILDMKWSEVGPKEGRNVSAHADDEPIRGPKGLVIVISSSRRTRFAAP